MARRGRKSRDLSVLRVSVLVLVAAIIVLAFFAFANAILGVNSPPRLGQNTSGINPYALEPQLCRDNAVVPTLILAGNAGTNASELILGTNTGNNMTGSGGNDCIVGGAGNDTINGGGRSDVCIGGPGNDRFTNCEVCDTTNCVRG
jgi:Ca2+-binding RTX toxin-like protein